MVSMSAVVKVALVLLICVPLVQWVAMMHTPNKVVYLNNDDAAADAAAAPASLREAQDQMNTIRAQLQEASAQLRALAPRKDELAEEGGGGGGVEAELRKVREALLEVLREVRKHNSHTNADADDGDATKQECPPCDKCDTCQPCANADKQGSGAGKDKCVAVTGRESVEQLWHNNMKHHQWPFGAPTSSQVWRGSHPSMLWLGAPAERCKQLDWVVLKRNSNICAAIVQQSHEPSRKRIMTYERADPSQPFEPLMRLPNGLHRPVSEHNRNLANAMMARLYGSKEELLQQVKAVVAQAGIPSGQPLLIMVVNAGHVDLLFNMECSAHASGADTSSLLVFAADERSYQACMEAGMPTVYAPNSFGKLPESHANTYGDETFIRMMWLKTASVWTGLQLGHDVFFQDADLVWFKDPWAWFKKRTTEPTGDEPGYTYEYDTYWQFDGATTERFEPFYANSGFFYLRNTLNTKHYWDRVTRSFDLMQTWASQQAVTSFIMTDMVMMGLLTVKILPADDFPAGYWLPNEARMQKLRKREVKPTVFHVNWTTGRPQKLEKLRKYALWALSDACMIGTDYSGDGSSSNAPVLGDRKDFRSRCCRPFDI